jgi:hypothetical protein
MYAEDIHEMEGRIRERRNEKIVKENETEQEKTDRNKQNEKKKEEE